MHKSTIHRGGLLVLLAMTALTTLRAQDDKGVLDGFTTVIGKALLVAVP